MSSIIQTIIAIAPIIATNEAEKATSRFCLARWRSNTWLITGMTATTGSERLSVTSSSVRSVVSRYSRSAINPRPSASPASAPSMLRRGRSGLNGRSGSRGASISRNCSPIWRRSRSAAILDCWLLFSSASVLLLHRRVVARQLDFLRFAHRRRLDLGAIVRRAHSEALLFRADSPRCGDRECHARLHISQSLLIRRVQDRTRRRPDAHRADQLLCLRLLFELANRRAAHESRRDVRA